MEFSRFLGSLNIITGDGLCWPIMVGVLEKVDSNKLEDWDTQVHVEFFLSELLVLFFFVWFHADLCFVVCVVRVVL